MKKIYLLLLVLLSIHSLSARNLNQQIGVTLLNYISSNNYESVDISIGNYSNNSIQLNSVWAYSTSTGEIFYMSDPQLNQVINPSSSQVHVINVYNQSNGFLGMGGWIVVVNYVDLSDNTSHQKKARKAANTFATNWALEDVSEEPEEIGTFDGEGTVDTPYQIKTTDDITKLANLVNAGNSCSGIYFQLSDNIDMIGKTFEPIGKENYPFSGHFDGKGYYIKGISVDATSFIGLFGYADGATINNVGIEDANLRGTSYIGGIVGYCRKTNITNCYTRGSTLGNDCVGAIVGYSGEGSVVQNCFSSFQHTKYQIYGSVGGLVGYNCGMLENSYYYGTINAKIFEKSTTGGIVGYNHTTGSIHYCYFIKYGDVMNGDFNYCGSLNWGDSYGTDSFDLYGITTSGSYLHANLNSWVNDHSSQGHYRKWTSESFPLFADYAETDESNEMINGHEYVDLGLPSGKLWARTNYGASSEGEYGIYLNWPSRNVIQTGWGNEWLIPSQKDFLELYNQCTFTWEYNANSVYGCKVIGPNGNSIFLPATGYKIMGGTPRLVGSDIYYWSDTEYESGFAYALQGSAGNDISVYQTWNIELAMFTIRPVANNNSSDTSHDYVDLALPSGLLWATTNVGANRAEDCGSYFAWGETNPKNEYSWATYKYANGSENSLTKYCNDPNYGNDDNKEVLEAQDDAATVNWGKPWRTPTLSETQELINYCTWTLTTQNGVNGYKVTGANGNSIFLPSGGVMQNKSCYFIDRSVVMSANLFKYSSSASVLNCQDGSPHWWYGWNRCWGYNVRPVTSSDPSGIATPTTIGDQTIIGIYDLQGHKLDNYQKGINVIRKKDGSIKKIVMN